MTIDVASLTRRLPRRQPSRAARAAGAISGRCDLLALALCLVALAASAWVATVVFDRLPHVEDDVAFLFQARTIASVAMPGSNAACPLDPAVPECGVPPR